MAGLKELIDFALSPLGLLLIVFTLILLSQQTREHLETNTPQLQVTQAQQATTSSSGVIQLPGADQATRKDRGAQVAINPKTGEKLPPTTYEQVRDLLPGAPSREGRDVWKQVVRRQSTFFREGEAVKRAQAPIAKPVVGLPKVKTTTVFMVKAQQVAGKDPQLSAALVSQQGLSGYMQTSGKNREQIVQLLGMTLNEVNQTLSQELGLDPQQLEAKYAADGKLTREVTRELKRKLEAAQQKLAAAKRFVKTDPKILKAKPDFAGIQSNWIADAK